MSNRKRTAFTLKCKAKEAPALKKYRGDVLSFAKAVDDSDKHRSLIKTDILYSRKQRRKDERKLKKARKHAYRCGRELPNMQTWTKSKEDAIKTDTKKKSLQKLKEKKKKQKARMKEMKKMKEKEEIDSRKQQLMEDNKKEDRMLKQLEKNLHLNKRKSKNLPQAFVNDGLDFLLDALDKSPEDMEDDDYSDEEEHGKRKVVKDEEDSEQEMDDDLEEEGEEYEENESDDEEEDFDFSDEDEESDSDDHHPVVDVISKKAADVKSILKSTSDDRQQKQVKFKSVTEENTVRKDKKKKESESNKKKKKDVTFDDDVDSNDEEMEEKDEIEEEGKKSDESSDENIENIEITEDIYGRLRDKEGNIVKSSGQTGKYIPPGKRVQISDEKKKFQLERLQKQLKGLVNRASEANMSQICSQIEAVYRSNSRAEVTEALSAIVIGACVSVTMTPERLAMEMMLLITILHGNIGTEV
ncbi:nucleolar MIF4G domain-containing protein 1-like, partial [Saccostrea cucullata]|uniref:nucleolar MIF4G domain-containing protein 1-like n=1 Tax=Saccostrea cuccullata TaxID=36930 RepID=UPI002ED3F25C